MSDTTMHTAGWVHPGGRYLSHCPLESGVTRYGYHRRWIAVHPHGDGTWYEGPRRQTKGEARRDLESYVEMLAWLKGRAVT